MDKSSDYNNLPIDEDLHIQAGLTDVGKNEDGDVEWMGSDKQWQEYINLVGEQEGDVL